jgi:hypothetical protein
MRLAPLNVLLVMTCSWVPPARLAIALANAGCAVDAVAPNGHAVSSTRALRRLYPYNGVLSSIRSALMAARPDFIIPCDDYATEGLHRLHAEDIDGRSGIAGVIERSLGRPEHYSAIGTRAKLLSEAKNLGICVPDTQILPDRQALHSWLATNLLPAYLKADGTSGGVGVRLVESAEQAESAFESLSCPPGVLRTVKRTLVDKDMRLLAPCLQRRRPVVSAQRVIEGSEANCAISCWQGRVLGCISVEVVKRADDYGPATVVRLIDNQEIRAAAEKLARRFQMSGLFGLDFILETATGRAYLLEMNARATQTCHMEMGAGRTLIHPLACEISGIPQQTAPVTQAPLPDTIALFPAEWKRDPASRYIASGFHDVPWEEPALIRYCLRSRLRDQSWMSWRKWRARKAALKEAELRGAALIESRSEIKRPAGSS